MEINTIKVGNKVNYKYTDNNGNQVVGVGKVVDIEWCPDDVDNSRSYEDITVITESGEEVNVWNKEVISII